MALTRPLFWSPEPIGWDEVLFLNAVDSFDMNEGAPHPPGFPYYVMAGQALQRVLGSSAAALATLGLLGALAGWVGVHRLARFVHRDERLALAAALLYAFIPGQWACHAAFYSDGPATGFALLSLSFLAFGTAHGSARELAVAALLSSLALGMRPHHVALLAAPWLAFVTVMLARRRARTCMSTLALLCAGLLPGILLVVHNLGGFDRARAMCAHYLEMANRIGSLKVSETGGWSEVLSRWYLDPLGFRGTALLFVAFAFVGIGVCFARAHRAREVIALASILTYAVIALFRFSIASTVRYGLAIGAFLAIFVPAGLLLVRPLWRGRLVAPLVALFLIPFAVWCAPLIARLRSTPAPVPAALRFLAAEGTEGIAVVVDSGISVHARRGLRGVPLYSELPMPFVPQWRFVTGLERFFSPSRRFYRLTEQRRPGAREMLARSWPEYFRRVGSRFRFHHTAYVYEEPARVLLSVGWAATDLAGDEPVQVATRKALLFVDPRARQLSCEAMPVAPAGHRGITLDVFFFRDEDWAGPGREPPVAASIALEAGAWTAVRCPVPATTARPAHACVLATRAGSAEVSGLRVRRLRTTMPR